MKPVVGMVVSNKMQKSVVVAVDRLFHHKLYNRYVKRTSKFMAHDEHNQCNIGDRVWTFLLISPFFWKEKNEAFFIFALLIASWENGKLRGGTFFNINLFVMEMSWNQTNCGVIDKELMSGESFDYF